MDKRTPLRGVELLYALTRVLAVAGLVWTLATRDGMDASTVLAIVQALATAVAG